MTTKKQKNQMLDYLVDRLLNCGKDIVPRTKEMISGIDSNYIKVGDDGIILLVDQVYPNNALNKLYRKAKKERENVGMVLYKDGKTFFRNAAEKNYFKMREDLSLRKYSNDEMYRMISFRPEENFIYDKKERKLQYFQPDSERLPEGLITFEFRPVHFDYEHIDPMHQFKPDNTDSKRLHIWVKKNLKNGKLRLEDKVPDKGILKER